MNRFISRADPGSLGLRDLLEARDHYHVHIANLPTVIGTAAGRYRIRRLDSNYESATPTPSVQDLGERTLENSDFRPWSWPCVLVFVDEWLDKSVLAKHPEATIPPVLYLPDGRQVRTCPILVKRRERNLPPAETAVYAADKFGPGFQVYVSDQGATRMGVASAIVEDGACAYLLASRHLTSGMEPASTVFALPRGKHKDIGKITTRSVDAMPLESVYPGFAGRSSQLTLDTTLVKLDRIDGSTSQYLGVGRMGKPIDLSADKMSINVIGCPVFAELPGGIRMEGQVHGLFYRHASLGGVDSLAEFLIGPRELGKSVETRPGDSGAVWFWDHAADADRRKKAAEEVPSRPEANGANDANGAAVPRTRSPEEYQPLAVQWGGHGFSDRGASRTTEFVLATSISAICKALEVDVVQEWSTSQSRYWGKVGHYNIGYAACFALQSQKAQAIFAANATAIGVSDDDIVEGKLPSATQTARFIALADVPDLVWRRTRGKDKANHFADMDEKGKGDFRGKTLLELWKSDPESRQPSVWNAFYDSIDPDRKPQHRGALPFRVAQLYDVMVEAVRNKALDRYICAAGVLAHYIGDACQPLHVSYLHHGQPDEKEDDGVHAAYEDDMLDHAAPEVVAGVKQRVASQASREPFEGGMGAADAVVQLMRRTIKELPPAEVLEVFERVSGDRNRSEKMWAELGDRTMDCMADGAVTLATVWQSAWTEGGGDDAGHVSLNLASQPVPTDALKALYDDKTFAESKWLSEM